jgi:rare lipoprotein A (peptidoglycan hydrolase)
VRRFRSALFLVSLGACAHESTSPPAAGPSAASVEVHRTLVPSYPPAASSGGAGDQALATAFKTAPALATLEGEASYYSDGLAGHPTASGEPYRPLAFTAAHRRLPLGTVLRITGSRSGRVVYVRVNDRGPYGSKRRILDLSRAAAQELGMLRAGVLEVRAEVVAYGPKRGR